MKILVFLYFVVFSFSVFGQNSEKGYSINTKNRSNAENFSIVETGMLVDISTVDTVISKGATGNFVKICEMRLEEPFPNGIEWGGLTAGPIGIELLDKKGDFYRLQIPERTAVSVSGNTVTFFSKKDHMIQIWYKKIKNKKKNKKK